MSKDVKEPPIETAPAAGGNAAKIAIVAVVALGGFLVALTVFGGGDSQTAAPVAAPTAVPQQAEPAQADAVAAYDVSLEITPDPPTPEGSSFLITILRDGAAVTGADVALRADMTEMAHDGVGGQAVETDTPGVYEAEATFPMRGAWGGSVVINESGQEEFRYPFTFRIE